MADVRLGERRRREPRPLPPDRAADERRPARAARAQELRIDAPLFWERVGRLYDAWKVRRAGGKRAPHALLAAAPRCAAAGGAGAWRGRAAAQAGSARLDYAAAAHGLPRGRRGKGAAAAVRIRRCSPCHVIRAHASPPRAPRQPPRLLLHPVSTTLDRRAGPRRARPGRAWTRS